LCKRNKSSISAPNPSLTDGGVYVFDPATGQISREIHVGKCPNWITITPDGLYVAVSNSGGDDWSIIDTGGLREVRV
jgi:DNA-binding beta-propeller fold protein YncE